MSERLCCLIAASTIFMMVTGAAELRDIEPMTANKNIWQIDKDQYRGKFPKLAWMYGKGDGEFIHRSKGMLFWGEKVHELSITESNGKIRSFQMTLVDRDATLMMEDGEFDTTAKRWNNLLTEKLGSEGERLVNLTVGKKKQLRIAWVCKHSVVVLSVSLGNEPERLELICYEKSYGLALLNLKERVKQQESTKEKEKKGGLDSEPDKQIEDGLDAREEKARIRSGIKEINARKAADGVSKSVQDAVNLLNVYRFLSRVPSSVKADKGMIEAAHAAAKICNEKGQLSHDFGHSTDKCNLAMNGGKMSMENSVTQYMDDAGSNNRAKRGHRKWCLNHNMGKTGFGIDGSYSAMYAMDQSYRGIQKDYSYPGHGFYPLDYLHGNAWSYYMVSGSAPKDSVVQFWKLKRYEEDPPKWQDEPDGKEYDVVYKNVFANSIVFEPAKEQITRRRTYLVRIKGSGLKVQYLVHLY